MCSHSKKLAKTVVFVMSSLLESLLGTKLENFKSKKRLSDAK